MYFLISAVELNHNFGLFKFKQNIPPNQFCFQVFDKQRQNFFKTGSLSQRPYTENVVNQIYWEIVIASW